MKNCKKSVTKKRLNQSVDTLRFNRNHLFNYLKNSQFNVSPWCFFCFPLVVFKNIPKMTVITGQSNGKKAYGKYSSAPTFNVPIMKVPLTPQGINELTAAPASAKVRVKYFYQYLNE